MSPKNKSTKNKAKVTTSTKTSQSTPPSTEPPPKPPLTAPTSPDKTATAPATALAFREFIEIADLPSVKLFLDTAASSSPEGQNLHLLWARAFKEGLLAGHNLYGLTVEKVEEAHRNGYKEGHDEGYDDGCRVERRDWMLEGHGPHCFGDFVNYDDYGNTYGSPFTSSVGTSTSEDALFATHEDSGTQTTPLATFSKATYTDETTLPERQDSASQTELPPSTTTVIQRDRDTSTVVLPALVTPASSPSTTVSLLPAPTLQPLPKPLNWADDVETTTFPIPPVKPPPRDLSILRSASPKPFASLQRRTKRSKKHFSQPFRHNSSFPSPRRSQLSSSRPLLQPTLALNWEDDPRLFELSRALKALGWVRPDPRPATRTSLFSKG